MAQQAGTDFCQFRHLSYLVHRSTEFPRRLER
jgi:hypothetical protein